MLFYELNLGEKTYKLRINTRSLVALEKKLGCSPYAVFGNINNIDSENVNELDLIPSTEAMVAILWASLQAYQHNIDFEKAYEVFDEFIMAGNSLADFVPVIFEVYKVSGLIPEDAGEEAAEEAKN